MKLDTTSRASYLLFVTEWKANYKALSTAIRQLKPAAAAYVHWNVELNDEINRRHQNKDAIQKAKDERQKASVECAAAQTEIERIRKLVPDAGTLNDHCRPDTVIVKLRDYSQPKDVANYMMALRKEGKRLAQIAWQREHSAPKELVAA